MKFSRSVWVKLAATALTLAAAGTATVAQARGDVYFSVGAHVAPGVSIGVSNAPVYYPPVYVQPAPVYVHPAPIVVAPPTYYSYGYARPAPVIVTAPRYYYDRPRGHGKHHKHWNHHRHGGYRY